MRRNSLDPSPHNSSSTMCFPNPMQFSAAPFSSSKPAAESPGRVCFQLACAIIIFSSREIENLMGKGWNEIHL